jgi:hypothetical protein
MNRYTNSGSRVHPTRHSLLGYAYFGTGHWQFVDRETGESIGMIYPVRSELEADIDRFAKERGFITNEI